MNVSADEREVYWDGLSGAWAATGAGSAAGIRMETVCHWSGMIKKHCLFCLGFSVCQDCSSIRV